MSFYSIDSSKDKSLRTRTCGREFSEESNSTISIVRGIITSYKCDQNVQRLRKLLRCSLCNHKRPLFTTTKVEDESHFLMQCILYENRRNELFMAAETEGPNFTNFHTRTIYFSNATRKQSTKL